MGFAHYSGRVWTTLGEVLVRENRTKRSGNADIPPSQYEKAVFLLMYIEKLFKIRREEYV